MNNRLRIGLLINRNRAAIDQADAALAEIAKLMPQADRARRRELRRTARQLWRTRWRLQIVGWILWFQDKR